MDAGIASGTLHPAPDFEFGEKVRQPLMAGAGKVPSALRVTAARGHREIPRGRSPKTVVAANGLLRTDI
jgi:hypothetical protein